MPRYVKVAAAQLGPINEGTDRTEVVERMLALLDAAIREDVELLAYPELCLTPYFPKRIRDDSDQFFETEMPSRVVAPLFEKAREARIAFHLGYAETEGGKHYNTAILVDEDGTIFDRYRKTHLPGVTKPDGYAKVYEPYYFAHGDTGFRVFEAKKAKVGIAICQDRRYPESFRCLGLRGAEIVLSGYNTPAYPLALAHNELVLRAGAYQNSLFVVGVAKAGVEDGVELIGGSCVVDPLGQVVAKASTTGDELVAARIDLDQMLPARRRWNFFGRRHPEHYGPLTEPVKRDR
ncbi:MAG: N-carbamoyl-D-amino-acid hydrolase [Candidatus Rokubacteria bacterium]|nr:N-carbamoyl-D-amino-acid hydrolase [Candidatus Rokubacteria bacterium]